MITINDAVVQKPSFEKVAEAELSGDVTKWHETIMQKFFEEVDFLPQNIGTDIVLSNVDTNKGYGNGSIVVWLKDKKVNFPIIVKNFKLSPFDVFVYNKDGEQTYLPSNFENIKKIITSDKMGVLENIWDKGNMQLSGLKTPGGVYPKQLVPISDQPLDMTYPPFSKMSGWRDNAKKEDIEKFAAKMAQEPEIKSNYVDNTGDLITNVIALADSKKQVIADTNKVEDIDLTGLVEAKQAITTIDSELFDVNQLQPVAPPSVCELRAYEYPSMEDFIESGKDMSDRFMATRNGRPIVGVVIDMKEPDDSNGMCTPATCQSSSTDPIQRAKEMRQQRDQIFISIDGSCYSTYRDYDKTGICFYGSKVVQIGAGSVEKVMKMIENNTSDDFISSNKNNRSDGSDKIFNPIATLDQGQSEYNYGMPACDSNYNTKLAVIYGAGDAFECMCFRGNYRKISVNGSNIYTSRDIAIIPANVATVQRVRSVESKVHQMAIMGAKTIYLIPETSIVFSTEYMKEYNKGDFLRPSLPLQKVFEDSNISKTAVEIDTDGGGYKITGEPY